MKINELFDDEFQRNLDPNLNKTDITDLDIDTNFKNPVSMFIKKMRYFVPIIDKCISQEDENHFVVQKNGIFTFIIRNGTFHVSVSIFFREMTKCDLCIFYQKEDYRGDILVNDITLGDTEYCYLEDFDNLSADETVHVLKDKLLPLLKRLGFSKDYSLNKNINQVRFN